MLYTVTWKANLCWKYSKWIHPKS